MLKNKKIWLPCVSVLLVATVLLCGFTYIKTAPDTSFDETQPSFSVLETTTVATEEDVQTETATQTAASETTAEENSATAMKEQSAPVQSTKEQNKEQNANKDSGKSASSTPQTQYAKTQTFTVLGITVEVKAQRLTEKQFQYIKSTLNNLPAYFANLNVKKISFLDSIANQPSYVKGLSYLKNGQIEFAFSSTDSNSYIKSAIYHEFGHFANYRQCKTPGGAGLAPFSSGKRWKDAFNADGNAVFVRNYTGFAENNESSQRSEAFAMMFDYYYTGMISGNSENVKSLCPNMYATMDEYIKNDIPEAIEKWC